MGAISPLIQKLSLKFMLSTDVLINPKNHRAIATALLHLSGVCDGAGSLDGQGFNKVDSQFGHSLAQQVAEGRGLSKAQQGKAFLMLAKYQRQLDAAGIELPNAEDLDAFLNPVEVLAVDQVADNHWQVVNETGKRGPYGVFLIENHWSCDCPGTGECKHIKRVRSLLEAEHASNVIQFPVAHPEPELEAEVTELLGPDVALEGIELNEQQVQALLQLQRFTRGSESYFLLTGYAGTGKTTLIQALLKWLRQGGDRRQVVFTAPTNKAVKVLEKMTARWGLSVDAMTIHRLLALRPKIDPKTGKQYFEPDYGVDSAIDQYKLIVIDEGSMISAELWKHVTDAIPPISTQQIIVMGDHAQLPPVGEPKSPVFDAIHSQSHLTQIMRFSGCIGSVTQAIRDNLAANKFPFIESQKNADGTGIWDIEDDEWMELLIRAFKSDAYRADPDYVRAIAYTNKRVESINETVRREIYGPDAPRFIPGERLIAQDPCLRGVGNQKSVYFQNSSECEVVSTHEGTQGRWKVRYITATGDEGNHLNLWVLHESEQRRFEQELLKLKADKLWREYYGLMQSFDNLRYAYALTTHKAQGSTYENAFVDIQNIRSNRTILQVDGLSVPERNPMLYTALTRASKRLFVLQ